MKNSIVLFVMLCVITVKAQENLTVSTNAMQIDAAEKSISILKVSAKTSWTASSNRSWLTIQPSSFESQPYAGAFLSTGVRVHPTAGNLEYQNLSETLTLVSVNPVIVKKPMAGGYTFETQIQITNNTIVVGGKIVNKVLVAVSDTNNVTGTGMYDTDQNGQPTNYYDPSTNSYKLAYFYNTTTPRKIYEILSPSATITNVIATAQENPASTSREATITVASGTTTKLITVTQAGSPVLSVSANSLVLAPMSNSSVSLQLKSTSNWSVVSNQSWLTCNKIGGSGNATLILNAAENGSTLARTALVTISAGGVTKLVNVTQYGSIPANVAWNQSYTGYSYTDISVVNDQVIWLSRTSDNAITFTVDGGKSWTTKLLPTYIPGSTGFCAVSATTAYIVSADSIGLWKTTDGANTWSLEPTGYKKDNPINAYGYSFPDFVYFWDVNNGIVYGDDNEIYVTNNAGVNWNLVTAPKSTSESTEWTFNNQAWYRVIGDAIYILVSNQNKTNRILRSFDKGSTWSYINPPTNSMDASFDFKDADNGLFIDFSTIPGRLYSTSNGGLNWNLISANDTIGYIKYIPNQNLYLSTNRTSLAERSMDGVKYSTDNGLTWTKNKSFRNIYNANAAFTSNGTIFLAGHRYLYSTKNIQNTNTSLNQVEIKTPTKLDLLFSDNINALSAQDTSHYVVRYRDANNELQYLNILAAKRDDVNPALVHVTLLQALPQDTITVYMLDLMDANGYPLLNGSALSGKTIINNLSGFDLIGKSAIKLYPNPASNAFKIDNLREKVNIQIIRLDGSVVLTKACEADESIAIENLPGGMYLVQIYTSEGIIKQKLVKK